jgi:glycosyltransferase involved in cell wall biosynthesis
VTVTQRDLDQYKSLGYIGIGISSPIGVDLNQYEPRDNDLNQPSLSFIGSLDWMPNLDGLNWFLKEVYPAIIKKYQYLIFSIAGRNTPKSIVDLSSDNILIHGEVDSAINFINDNPIMIVPLLSGSGMRVKILEGMALKKVVISTAVGAEGINAVHKESILIADTPAEFLECIKWLLDSPVRMTDVGQRARQFIGEYFDESKNAEKLVSFYNSILV